VRFTGAVPYEEMPRYLRVAQGFATASVTEVLPLSLIEALAAGLPVVGIDSPGVRDLVTDGQNGLLSANDLAAFTAKLARFLIDEDLRKRLCAAARPSAREFDIQRTAHRLENHYSNVCAQSRERAANPIQAAVTWPRGRVR
jgi:1,2-diacylglycerol 3-alpha-glucosyltransferase